MPDVIKEPRKATRRELKRLISALKARDQDRVITFLTGESPPAKLPKNLDGTVAADIRFLDHCYKILRRDLGLGSHTGAFAGFYHDE